MLIFAINVKKNCSLSTTYNGDMTHRKQQKLKSAQRDTNLRAGSVQPDRTF